MFKCPNCNKMFMQWDQSQRVLQCFGGRCFQKIEVPSRLIPENGVPSNEDLLECIRAFRRTQRRKR